jgi:phosphate/phosphite/phosphonate ABC transporter binding protein
VEGGTSLTFGLVAAADAAVLTAFDELAAWLHSHTSVDLERRTAATYQALAASVREGSSDVAWLPPVAYAWLAEAVTPLGSIVRAGNTRYSAALLVRKDAKIASLADLAGTRAGWVDPWSAAGYVVPRIELARAGMDPTTSFRAEAFHGTHREALLALARGDCDVAGTYARPQEGDKTMIEGAWTDLDIGVEVRVLSIFGSIPPDVLAVRRNLAPASYERVLEALRRASADDTARPLLQAVFGGGELREGIEAGHDALRRAFERATAVGLFD